MRPAGVTVGRLIQVDRPDAFVTHIMSHVLVVIFFSPIVLMCSSQCPVHKLPARWKLINVSRFILNISVGTTREQRQILRNNVLFPQVRESDFCYAIGSTQTNRAAGRSQCRGVFKGYPARFHDSKSLLAVARNIRINTQRIWFDALSKPNGGWIWSDGTSIGKYISRLCSG